MRKPISAALVFSLFIFALGCGDDDSDSKNSAPEGMLITYDVDPNDYSSDCLEDLQVNLEPFEVEDDRWETVIFHDVNLDAGNYTYEFTLDEFRACEDKLCGNDDQSRGVVYEEEPFGIQVTLQPPLQEYQTSTFSFFDGDDLVFTREISDDFDKTKNAHHETLIEFAPNTVLKGGPYTMQVDGTGKMEVLFEAIQLVRFVDPACLGND